MPDEILVKGKDGKLYILGAGGLVLYEEGKSTLSRFHDQPKGVSGEEHAKLESKAAPKVPELAAAEVIGASKVKVMPVPVAAVSHDEHPLRVELEEAIDQVLQEVTKVANMAPVLGDALLKKRFRTIVSARLRDVRDRNETVEMLTRPQKVGGMELSMEHITRSMEQIEKAFQEFQAKWRVVEEKKSQEWKKKQAEKWASREDKEKEKKELEDRYKKLVGEKGVMKQAVPEGAAPAPLGARSVERGTTSKAVPSPRSSSAGIASYLSENQLSQPAGLLGKQAAAPSLTVKSSQEGREEKKMLMPPPPMVVQQKTTVSTPPPKPAVSPPKPPQKITDVRKAPQLLGPLEELSTLTLADFRRLAQDPRERTARILGKIEFIGKESLNHKLQAKEAWLKSPLYQEYSRIMRKAFLERSTPLKILESAGQATLTKEEWYAIMEMNQKLRF